MGQRLQRQLGRGEDIPHHIGTLQVGIQAIAAVVRQGQVLAGEIPCLLGQLQALAQGGVLRGVGKQLLDRLARAQQGELALAELGVVLQRCATAQQQAEQQRNRVAQDAVG